MTMQHSARAGGLASARNATAAWLLHHATIGRPALLGTLSMATIVLAWQISATFGFIDTLFLPPPTEIMRALVEVVTSDTFPRDLQTSAYEFGLGLGISILVGGTLGVLAGWYRPFDELLRPIVIAVNSVPNLALIPIIILLFGIGTTSKIVLVLLSCIVVMEMNTQAGVENVDRQLKRMARSFGATDRQLIRTVVLPGMVPFFMTGVRICVGKAVVAVAVAELFGSVAGLGNILIKAQSEMNMAVMYAAVVLLTVIGIALTQTAVLLERLLTRWKD
ncbi:ABC transporter permease [Poseidonocella sp. HB161398]|uniref:ABC transporter permease n=1 Tax=Poseidonocella sp. HB161398 TaxID=2320855 RepID=UPI0014871254|nr:ABC transporter permease [Poseidonocella sp. HB161398]